MKQYYFIRQDKLIQPIALVHEDGTTALYDTKTGRISFEGVKKGDTIKMYNANKLEGICTVLNMHIINNMLTMEISDIKECEDTSEYLKEMLQIRLDAILKESYYSKKDIEKAESTIMHSQRQLKKYDSMIEDIAKLAGDNNIVLNYKEEK